MYVIACDYMFTSFFISEDVRTIRSVPITIYKIMKLVMNSTDPMSKNENSTTLMSETGRNDNHMEAYIIPTVMSCPLFVSIYIIVRLYRKLKQLNANNMYNSPILRMTSPYETDL